MVLLLNLVVSLFLNEGVSLCGCGVFFCLLEGVDPVGVEEREECEEYEQIGFHVKDYEVVMM